MSLKLDIPNTFKRPERISSLPNNLLVGAGPANCSPRVIFAMNNPSTSAYDDDLLKIMDEIKEMLKYVFQTKNEMTLVLQASGNGGLEAALTNLVEPGEKIIVPILGFWSDRIANLAESRQIEVIRLEKETGVAFSVKELEKEIIKHKPSLIFVVHGNSSVGVLQPIEGLGEICRKHNCLLAVDAVVTLGGVPFFTDRWGVDVAVSATQKSIGAPPGYSLLTFSPKAVERMRRIKTVPPFYLNVLEACKMWTELEGRRRYFVTYNSHMLFAIREALLEIVEEGLENRWQKHKNCAERFWAGFENLGLKHYVRKPEDRLYCVTCFYLPENVNWKDLLDYALEKHQVSISFGIGPTYGKAIRVGFMGYNSRLEVVDYVLKVIEQGIQYCKANARPQ